MDNEDFSPKHLADMMQGLLSPVRGYFLVNWIGQEVEGTHPGLHIRGGRKPKEEEAGPAETFFDKPRRRLITLDQVQTVIEHDKGAILRLGFESLIVSENFTELAATLFGGGKERRK